MRKTKIIATIGPSTEDPQILTRLLEEVDVVRINLAHGTWDKKDTENHTDKIKIVQKIAKTIKKPIAILVDLKGNKIRIGDLIKQTIDLKKDAMINIRFTEDTVSQSVDEIVVNASHVFENIENEDVILIDDGLIKLQVNEVDDENQILACTVQEGGLLSRRKGLEVVDKVAPESYKLLISVDGKIGTIAATGTIALEPGNQDTILSFQGDAKLTGVMARMGQRVLSGVGRMFTNQFFKERIFKKRVGERSIKIGGGPSQRVFGHGLF